MAKTALLAQNDNLTIKETKTNVGRSVFDLSHSTTFPIDLDGAILPICAIETVPSDSFEISCECLLRQLSPLKVPLMTNIRLNTAFYWCDNRLAWKKWDRFIQGGRSGNEVYDIPRVYNHYSTNGSGSYKYTLADKTTVNGSVKIDYSNSLHTYFGISFNNDFSSGNPSYSDYRDDSEELPIAFPFFDYQLICRDYYTDIDRLPDSPNLSEFTNYKNITSDWAYSNLFPPDDDEIKLNDGIQEKSGFQSGDDSINTTHGFVLDKVRYHNVRDDYFTSSKKAPMRGTPPSIPLASAKSTLDFSKAAAEFGDQTYLYGVSYLGLTGESVVPGSNNPRLIAGSSSTDSGEINSHITGAKTPTENMISALNLGEATLDINTNITAAELLLLSQLSQWQILNMLAEPKYDDFLNVHFNGVKVGEAAVEKPIYIGGTSQIIHINEILQQSASDQTSFLGSQGATLHSLENNYVGKFFCNSYGWLIGVCYLQADLLYNPAIPRGFSRRTKEDFYFPEFANLSMQAILNKEIFFSNDSDWNNTPWGYTGCFDELRSIPNHVAGDCINSSYQDLQAWTLRRNFTNENKPSMSSEFLSEKGNIDFTAWQVPSMPKFMLQCANYIKAVRPMPYVAIPKAL